jgi:hypothetical protein
MTKEKDRGVGNKNIKVGNEKNIKMTTGKRWMKSKKEGQKITTKEA